MRATKPREMLNGEGAPDQTVADLAIAKRRRPPPGSARFFDTIAAT
jgi:hypothetical protein